MLNTILKSLGKSESKPFKPNLKGKEWIALVKSFNFDRLPSHQKGAAFRQIMSFR